MASKRQTDARLFRQGGLATADLTWETIRKAIDYAYRILDTIDSQLVKAGSERLAGLIELANLSSVIGNLVAGGIAQNSGGCFVRNGPHKYPDLLHKSDVVDKGVELKVALEKNKPKGHLPKAGFYVTIRYVLGDENGAFGVGKDNRGDVVWIWEVKFGWLDEEDFSFSSTEGDSGKTAVITTSAYAGMDTIFADSSFCPYSPKSKYRRDLPLFD